MLIVVVVVAALHCGCVLVLLRRIVAGEPIRSEVVEVHSLSLKLESRHAAPVLIHTASGTNQAVGTRRTRRHRLMVGDGGQAVVETVGPDGRHLRHSHRIACIRVWHGSAGHVVQVRVLLGPTCLSALEMILCVLQVIGTSGVASSN